ncbi:TetR family transcriptional regulator [filamentous cyanobacterium LEGE 11480]|uniref:TetR family transcriptional regulator n=1 Tax=Romeriopsis navalis LEGE 11480 TaxID=2777977 RepID=A0A928VJ10_9CYAN|nr:TetR/AcrR family transcriptional regulator [Romeriopsis navalis]MBE9029496.1 TetR family transcriptional regulator [Romeriopsis navalis LEGE 11480]
MVEKSADNASRAWRKPKQARSLARVNRILDVAEAMFVRDGYAAATTKQIAAEAKVPIGSLYQFFPDKSAILQALAERYTDLLNAQLQQFDTEALLSLPLPEYVQRFNESIDQFFADNPGYRATFIEITTSMPETDEAMDRQLIQTFTRILPKLNDTLSKADCEAIAFVLVKSVGNLLWVASGQTPEFRQRLVRETQQLTLNYLQSYLPN